MIPCRQNKLEEALLFSGQFTDALQALIDWLYRVEPQLAEDQPVHGDIDLVLNLIDNHKVDRIKGGSARASSGGLFIEPCPVCWHCLVSAGVPEGVGEEDGQRSGPQALSQGADREQPRRLVLGQSADAGAEHPLGDGVQPVGVQAGAPGAGAVSGTDSTPAAIAGPVKESAWPPTDLCVPRNQAEEFHSTVHILLEWLAEAEQSLRFHGSLPDDEEAVQALIEQHKVKGADVCSECSHEINTSNRPARLKFIRELQHARCKMSC